MLFGIGNSTAAKSLQSCLTLQLHRRQPTRLLCPWDSPGKNTGVGCHFLLQCRKVKNESEVAQSCPILHDPDNHAGVITDLEPDILESEVKWALESITTNKASGGDGIPVELCQILKDDAVKLLYSIC